MYISQANQVFLRKFDIYHSRESSLIQRHFGSHRLIQSRLLQLITINKHIERKLTSAKSASYMREPSLKNFRNLCKIVCHQCTILGYSSFG